MKSKISRIPKPFDRSEIERQEFAEAILRELPRDGSVEMQLGLRFPGFQLQPNRSMAFPNRASALSHRELNTSCSAKTAFATTPTTI
jgi:hypothetical protein